MKFEIDTTVEELTERIARSFTEDFKLLLMQQIKAETDKLIEEQATKIARALVSQIRYIQDPFNGSAKVVLIIDKKEIVSIK